MATPGDGEKGGDAGLGRCCRRLDWWPKQLWIEDCIRGFCCDVDFRRLESPPFHLGGKQSDLGSERDALWKERGRFGSIY